MQVAIDARSMIQRIKDLEVDNNTLRVLYGHVAADNSRLREEFEQVSKRCEKLIAKVNEFVGRFAVVN